MNGTYIKKQSIRCQNPFSAIIVLLNLGLYPIINNINVIKLKIKSINEIYPRINLSDLYSKIPKNKGAN